MDAILSYDMDVIIFTQHCSLGGRWTYFTVNACFDNVDDFIPLNAPWEEHKCCVWHWCILDHVVLKIYYL